MSSKNGFNKIHTRTSRDPSSSFKIRISDSIKKKKKKTEGPTIPIWFLKMVQTKTSKDVMSVCLRPRYAYLIQLRRQENAFYPNLNSKKWYERKHRTTERPVLLPRYGSDFYHESVRFVRHLSVERCRRRRCRVGCLCESSGD